MRKMLMQYLIQLIKKKVTWNKCKRKLRILLLTVTVLYICGILLKTTDEDYSQFAPANLSNSYLNAQLLQELEISVLHDKSGVCEPPQLDPFSPEVLRLSKDLPRVVCEGKDWVKCYLDECRVIKEILLTKKNIFCIYKDILYVNDFTTEIGPAKKVDGNGVYKLVASDQVKVSCTSYDGLIPSRWFGYKVGFRPVPKPPATPFEPFRTPGLRPQSDSYNVMIIGFDSTSHSGFVRKMPKSYKVLTKELNAVVLNKYNILGDGTPAALFPMLTGKSTLEHEEYRRQLSTSFVDEKILIFHLASTLGYRTIYYEDMPWIGTFQTRLNGFARQPADHYLRSMLTLESESGRKWWHGIKGRYCIGDTPQYAMMFNLTRQFYDLDGMHFSFTFIVDVSHDDFEMITTADEELADLLRSFKDREDTMVVVMGDHGTRFDSIRETYQGKLEELLPFMAIRLPTKLAKSRPEALKALEDNANVLTTPFDIHTTFLDVMGASGLRNRLTIKGSYLPRGISLLEPIPPSRSCGEAGVAPYYCSCAAWRPLPSYTPQYTQAALALVQYINNITRAAGTLCRIRKLTSIEWVWQKVSTTGHHHNAKSEEERRKLSTDYYQAKVITSPDNAVFEGVVTYSREENRYLSSVNSISRTTKYGSEGWCVWDSAPHLGLFCYCGNKWVHL